MVLALALSEMSCMQLEIFLYKKIKQQKLGLVDAFFTQKNHIFSHTSTLLNSMVLSTLTFSKVIQ